MRPIMKQCSVVLLISLLFSLAPIVNAQTLEAQKNMLQMQIQQKDQEIMRAESDLRSAPSFSLVCCLGGNLFFPLGTIVWYFVDVAPKKEAKEGLKETINRLTKEKEQLQNQLQQLILKEK